MMPTSKHKKILFWLGLSLPMLALLAMTWLVHQSSGQFSDSYNWVMRNYKVLDLFEQTQLHIVDAEANQRGYLLTGHAEYLEPYRAAMQDIRDNLAELKKFTRRDPAQQANVLALEKMVGDELVFDPASVVFSGSNPASNSVVLLTQRGKAKLDQMRRVLFAAHEEQEQALGRQQERAEADVFYTQIMSVVLIVAVSLALAMVLSYCCAWRSCRNLSPSARGPGRLNFRAAGCGWMNISSSSLASPFRIVSRRMRRTG